MELGLQNQRNQGDFGNISQQLTNGLEVKKLLYNQEYDYLFKILSREKNTKEEKEADTERHVLLLLS